MYTGEKNKTETVLVVMLIGEERITREREIIICWLQSKREEEAGDSGGSDSDDEDDND